MRMIRAQIFTSVAYQLSLALSRSLSLSLALSLALARSLSHTRSLSRSLALSFTRTHTHTSGPTTDDTIGVPLIRSEDPAAINVAILVFLLMLACALAFGCCFCEPRAEDEHLFDALGGRPFRTLLN